MAAVRRLSVSQVMQIVEGAEILANVTGLSISEIVNLVLGEPTVEEAEEGKAAEA